MSRVLRVVPREPVPSYPVWKAARREGLSQGSWAGSGRDPWEHWTRAYVMRLSPARRAGRARV